MVGLVRERPAADEVAADLGDAAALRVALSKVRAEFVVHLAAIVRVGHPEPLDFYRVNVVGTLNLLEALSESAASGVRKVVLASSAAVYGNNGLSRVPEDAPHTPANHYAMSKLVMERLAQPYLSRLPLVVARPFNYTGPGQREQFVIAKIVAHFRRREAVLRLGNLHASREINDVRTVVRAYRGLLEEVPAGTTVNLCSGKGYSLLQVVEALKAMTGHTLEIRVDDALVRANEVPFLVGDPTRFRRLLTGMPQYSLEETLDSMMTSQS